MAWGWGCGGGAFDKGHGSLSFLLPRFPPAKGERAHAQSLALWKPIQISALLWRLWAFNSRSPVVPRAQSELSVVQQGAV